MPNPAPDNSKKTTFLRRSASTLGLWAVVGGALWSRQAWAYVGLVGLLTLISSREYFQMLKTGGVKCFPRYGMLLTVVYSAVLYWTLVPIPGYQVPPIAEASELVEPGVGAVTTVLKSVVYLPDWIDGLSIFAAIAGAFTLQLRHPIRGLEPLQAVASNVLGFIYIPFLFNFAAKLVFLTPGPGQVPGAMLLLWMIAVTKFSDMGAYIVGSMIGKHKMIPHVSPGKTWQGFGGAIFFALLAGCGLYALCKEDMPSFATGLHVLGGWPHVIVLSIVLCLLAVVGDLAESIVKRSLSVKDSGQMLPGIGGGLDLIDSLCFTAPVLYFYLKWMPV
ncbi:phosphatidate cytidylyltransferase [Luteolibacter sp. GHJ8]|uniref:Phosphatidate cytidylyltransferase n=1 Tax=Luteolibacter rhizosphaerae TaxID=2989719 RepID=A0ABT3G7U1_9BACT|nr:phosphatidate cytidylyltransferase [Luteolibacter rhizosphaerae]MCW1915928.1 phosphatidate cytidylyltransferase [Luteolibacter rhizosphaerae]